MSKFYPLKVKEITKETADCVSVVFDVPSNLQSEYLYKQGQYITLKLTADKEEIRRSYSICSSPVSDKELRVAIKKVKDGKVSTFINDKLKIGDELEVMTPMGNFYTETNPNHKKNYVLFAGGSGITPMLSIIKTILHTEPQSSIVLFYGNKDEASVIFKSQLEKLKADFPGKAKFIHILENQPTQAPELHKGLMTQEKIISLIENYVGLNLDNEFFVCGPTVMMENVKAVLTALKIESKKIHIEYFSAATPLINTIKEENNSSTKSKVTVIYDDVETNFELDSIGKSVLDAAIDAGVDAPYSCKGAVCCTCRAKLVEGKVKMDANYALTEEEVEAGFILTCQAHPLTGNVIINYDEQ